MVNSRQRRPLSRLIILRVVVVLAFAILAGQLWRLQIVQGDDFRWKSNNNRFREISDPAPRGVIYDRQGQILALNRPRYQVVVVPEDLPDEETEQVQVLWRLMDLLEAELQEAAEAASVEESIPITATSMAIAAEALPTLDELRAEIDVVSLMSGFRPIVVAESIPRQLALLLQEESTSLPGVRVQVQPRRDYPTGDLTAHIVGYTGAIPEERLDEYTELGYAQTEQIGLAGLEVVYEDDLKGKAGLRAVVVDVLGREVSTIGRPEPPTPGNSLVLTIDLELQRAAQDALSAGLRAAYRTAGVAIAMDPRNGAILALVSLPSYDNNLFADEISAEAYGELSANPDYPLINHAISGIYPPGSTHKIIPAAAGLQEEVITPRTLLGDSEKGDGANDGVIWLPNRYFPWDRRQDQPFYCWVHDLGYGHGLVNLVTALAESCDSFFYQLAGGYGKFEGLGLEALDGYTLLFGLGQPTGIDLPAENAGLVPDARWKRLTYGQNWVTGDTYNIAIGQGFLLATPMQVLNAAAAVANGGYLYRPQLVHRITDANGTALREFRPELIRELPIARENLEVVRQGLFEAVNREHGTATAAALPNVAVAGKTGTAEYFADSNEDGWPDRDANGRLPTHAWFTAFAPFEEPEIALVVLIEGGGEGSKTAVPVAVEILQAYFAPETPENPLDQDLSEPPATEGDMAPAADEVTDG